jgi:hypothetical protein
MSLYSADPHSGRRILLARDATLAATMLEAWRMHATARGGSLREAGPNVWHAIDANGVHYATLTLT